MHGMAGSAALILLTLQQAVFRFKDYLHCDIRPWVKAGNGTLSMVIAIPLRYSSRSISWLHHGLQVSIGTVTIALGLMLIYTTGFSLLS
jgi:hypothetical protein